MAFKKQGHFVVIESIGDDKATVLDPGIGRVEIEKRN
ncbi:cysteine peptidase family C39 domain-containing protein [Streptococcus gallolyticus]